jgi:two-component system response regulator DesR
MPDTPGPNATPHTVLCVDDNAEIAAALELLFARTPDLEWLGWLPVADGLVEQAARIHPALILVDIDLPGTDPFRAVEELSERLPDSRAVMFSGHVRPELVDRALNAGAWGYVSKNDGEEELLSVLRQVAAGEFAMSSEAMRMHV